MHGLKHLLLQMTVLPVLLLSASHPQTVAGYAHKPLPSQDVLLLLQVLLLASTNTKYLY